MLKTAFIYYIQTDREVESMMVTDHGVVNRYLNLPLFLRDVVDENVPGSFHQLLGEHTGCSPVDELILALHTLLLESGFVFLPKINVSRGV